MTTRRNGRFVSPPHDAGSHLHPDRQPKQVLFRFLERNQCPHCLGWSAGARRLAEQMAGQRGHMRPCSCTEPVAPTGQEPLDFGGAA